MKVEMKLVLTDEEKKQVRETASFLQELERTLCEVSKADGRVLGHAIDLVLAIANDEYAINR